jgi:nitrate/nitrite-specific signal transduction histidine kinase
LNTKKLVDIHTKKVDFNRYTPEEIKAILDDRFVTEYWREMKEAIQTQSPKVKEYERKLHDRVETVANSIDLRKAKAEIRTRYVSVIASIFMVALCVYCVTMERYLGAGILAILAVIFMAMALEYRKFELSYKKIKLLFSK